jgi:hypothetical protein
MRAQFEYRLESNQKFFTFRTRGGARVPLAIQEGKSTLGIFAVTSTEGITPAQRASAASFLSHYSQSKVLFVGFDSPEMRFIDDRMALIPAEALFFE